MDKFIVSARKYRPQNFKSVIGQEHITTTLKNAITHNQLAHAFLFCGPRGVGKTTCARILAKTINCTNRTAEGEACNTCSSCVSFDRGTSMNIHELDAASNNSVDDIRVITDQVRFAPQAGDYKVYIIDEVHMLSQQAFNAFLKTLEEPPPFAIFILATTEKHKILPTILSRCQIFDFKRITTEDTVEHLEHIVENEQLTAEQTALHVIAQKSEGCLRDALSILDKIVSFTNGTITYNNTLEHLNILDEDYFFTMLDLLQNQQTGEAMLLLDTIMQKGFEADAFMESYTEFVRNLLVSTDPKVASLLDVAEEFKIKYKQAAQQVPVNWMIAALNLLTENAVGYRQAKNKKLHAELTLIKLAYLHQAITLTQNESNEPVKKKFLEQSRPLAFRVIAPIAIPQVKKVAKGQKEEKIPEATITIQKAEKVSQKKTDDTVIKELPTLSSLQRIQNEIAQKTESEKPAIGITEENLKSCIAEIAQTLKSLNKETAASQLLRTPLRIRSSETFTFVADSTLHSRFIQAERATIIEALQKAYNNPQTKYEIIIEESETDDTEDHTPRVSKKEQYLRMVEKNPWVQILKENLKLTLE